MKVDPTLLNKIYGITRGDLETALFPFPDYEKAISQFTFLRLTRLSRFWKQQNEEEQFSLERSTEDLISGLYGQLSPWIFAINGGPQEIECCFGTHKETFC